MSVTEPLIRRRQAARLHLLLRLYEATHGRVGEPVALRPLTADGGAATSLTLAEAETALGFLRDAGLVRLGRGEGLQRAALSHTGAERAETALLHPRTSVALDTVAFSAIETEQAFYVPASG